MKAAYLFILTALFAMVLTFTQGTSHASSWISESVQTDKTFKALSPDGCELVAEFKRETFDSHVLKSKALKNRVLWNFTVREILSGCSGITDNFNLSIPSGEVVHVDGRTQFVYPDFVHVPGANTLQKLSLRPIHMKNDHSGEEHDDWILTGWQNGIKPYNGASQ